MKEATLTRGPSTKDGTFGSFTSGPFFRVLTLERQNSGDDPRIPSGKYITHFWIDPTIHPKHGCVYEVMSVPRRSAILIHSANVIDELLGCIAPGLSYGVMNSRKCIQSSKVALASLEDHMNREDFTLIIKDN